MGTQKFLFLSMIKTQLGFLNKGFSEEFTCKNMLRLANFFWVLPKYVFFLLGFISRFIFRLFSADSYKKRDSDFEADHLQQDDQIALVSETEEENHEFVFGFRFQNSGTEHSVLRENSLNHNTSKYHQFTSTKDYRGFIEEPETVSCSVQELFLSPNDQNSWEFNSIANKSIISAKTEDSVFQENSRSSKTSKYQFISTKDVKGFIEEPERITFRLEDFSVGLNDFPNAENGNQDSGEFNSKENNSITSGETEDSVFQSNSPNQKTSRHQFISNNDFWGFVEKPEVIQDFSVGPKDFQIVDNGNLDFDEFYSEAENSVTPEQGIFSSDCYFQGKKETTGLEINHSGVENSSQEVGLNSRNPFWCFDFDFKPKSSVSSEEVDSITSDYFSNSFVDEESENPNLEFTEEIPNPAGISFLEPRISCTDDDFIEFEPVFQDSAKSEPEDLQETEEEGKSEEPESREKSWDYDYEDDDDDDDLFGNVLLKHQESVEQMKAEMKNAKGKGMLPTILEESESPPKVGEDLKPLMRIDEKFEHKDRLEEIQKVYKGYAEKMRKLDVLNYQTLHGISFLQLKDQIHQGSAQKSSVSAIKSLLLPNLLQVKLRRIFADPTLKSITDLHRNLELVYVGHACLSWEILHWQYRKAMEMLEDEEGEGNTSSYNHVAGEFQQFRVLLDRFVENEPFQGPRVQTYAQNRCDIRSILQVPVIKEDSLKDRKDSTVWEDYEVSAAMLTQVIDESMLVFWEFLEADKDEANVILKGIQSTNHVDLQDPSDSEFLMEIKTILQKKEKRLKDLLRSGNCLVKKFQKHQESRLSGALLFAQVELKLVSRVMNMSRLTSDQLVWCQKKLNKIPHLRPAEYKRSRLSRNRRTVNRAYGGVLSGGAVRERIIRAFLVEEQKIVKKVLKIQKAKEKQAGKS
ncbi:hypothetical protein RHGRI_033682 [Rhododendron griersonianum]|uniref:Ribosomal protein L34Ae n=1 Tax=Rhododendron griersonianum TaxID=479676 RepID=A0AAV6I126_9ERIC|nr:hypothetical protein RHGRI_033682 [Rhododendron griersonianum]